MQYVLKRDVGSFWYEHSDKAIKSTKDFGKTFNSLSPTLKSSDTCNKHFAQNGIPGKVCL